MATENTLDIVNHFGFPITVYVSNNNWDCCDTPVQNQPVAYIQPNTGFALPYVRTDGHGCDGGQGYFQLDINITMNVALNFDSHGAMSPPAPSGCNAAVSLNSDGTYTLIVYAS